MTLYEAVFAALAGGSPSARVYPEILPQRVILPALTFTLITGEDDFHLLGPSGLIVRYVQVDSWAGTRLSADSQIEAARLAMLASLHFQVNAISVAGADPFETDTERFRSSREFTLWLQQA